MKVKEAFFLNEIFVQSINAGWLDEKNIHLDVARLDLIHPVISGNKFFKLKYYLKDAREKGFDCIATFGGTHSNHIVAAAFACYLNGFKSTGIIRGEKPMTLSHTLAQAQNYGMDLKFMNRADYRKKELIKLQYPNIYWINEGGYGHLGMKGASEILSFIQHSEKYSHIICAAGTGTMLAGLIHSSFIHQKIIGISIMKGNQTLEEEVKRLLPADSLEKNFTLIHDYHFGGYAKYPPQLLKFMRDTWLAHQLPTDIIYTGKTFFALQQLIMTGHIPGNGNVLFIHSGGLQGNYSLSYNDLRF